VNKRPIVRYHGGKWKLAPWIIDHFPKHKVYVEPYGGGGSVLLRKNKSYAEVYNDLDGEIVNLFRVVRERGEELISVLQLTPFAREEYLNAWYASDDPLEQARRTLIRSFMGFGSAAITLNRKPHNDTRGISAKTGFRANSNRSGTTPAHDWKNYPFALEEIIKRLQGVVIENRDAMQCMLQHDSEQTLFYVDPPYVKSTRDVGEDYKYEMTDEQHIKLSECLNSLKGMIILSCYDSELYQTLYSGWTKDQKFTFADGAKKRIEVIYMKNIEGESLWK